MSAQWFVLGAVLAVLALQLLALVQLRYLVRQLVALLLGARR